MNKDIKCYISSDSNYNLLKLEKILEKFDVSFQNQYDFFTGSSFSDLIKQKIKGSDFILAVITEKSQNVLYELGIAEAFKKPMFILVEPNVKLPFFLEGKMYFQLDWSQNTQLLELSLENYIQDISIKYRRYKKRKIESTSKHLTPAEKKEILNRIRQMRDSSFKEVDLINLIMDVFNKINIQAVSELKLGDNSRVDIAINNEMLSSYFGNPLLIEVKAGRISHESIKRAQSQLQSYINKTNSNFGILLYFDKANKRFEKEYYQFPNILMFDIEDFINGIISQGFEDYLITSRNELVHGSAKMS